MSGRTPRSAAVLLIGQLVFVTSVVAKPSGSAQESGDVWMFIVVFVVLSAASAIWALIKMRLKSSWGVGGTHQIGISYLIIEETIEGLSETSRSRIVREYRSALMGKGSLPGLGRTCRRLLKVDQAQLSQGGATLEDDDMVRLAHTFYSFLGRRKSFFGICHLICPLCGGKIHPVVVGQGIPTCSKCDQITAWDENVVKLLMSAG